MKLVDLLKQIEGHRFDVYVNLASGFSVFRMALEDSEVLRELIVELRRQPRSKQIVIQHLTGLLEANDQPEYAHPHDAAIAGYLFALSRVDTRLTREAIDNILQTPQLWWSRRLAKYIRENLSVSANHVEFVDAEGRYTQLEARSSQTKDQVETVLVFPFTPQDEEKYRISVLSKSHPVERIFW